MSVLFATTASPVGELLLVGDGERLHSIHLQEGERAAAIEPGWRHRPSAFAAPIAQLGEFFAGRRRRFELELAPAGTPFQQRAWRALRELPYGTTVGYGELAARIGAPRAARAVGLANARNPLAIVVPCHRVVGAGGALTGYAGGLERKRALLELEAASPSPPGEPRFRLLGADRVAYESALPGELGGHRRNRVYGRLDCAGAQRWIAKGHYVKQRVFFADEQTAIAAGYRPCAGCMRERYLEWKASAAA